LDKWKKKFYLVFTRERGVLDLSLYPNLPVDLKNITLNPYTSTRVGERILKTNHKFWIIYLHLIADKLNDFAKATLRTRLFGDPQTGTQGLFPSTSLNYEELFKEIGSLIDAEKLVQQSEPEHLPVFGSAMSNEVLTAK
jgi:hypothetical protein